MFENHSIICPSSRGKIKALVLKVTHLSEAPQGWCQVRVWLMVCGVCATIAEPAPNHRRAMASPCAAASITLGDAIQTISFTEVKWFVKTTWVLRQLCSINSLTKISRIDSHFHQVIQIIRYRGKIVRRIIRSQLRSQCSFLWQIFFILNQKGWPAISKLQPLSLFISLLLMLKKAFDNVRIEI